jgi:hypothetical protein
MPAPLRQQPPGLLMEVALFPLAVAMASTLRRAAKTLP